ncbi:YhcN/YlaJ family sporulation lipoprotein [Pelotomaculum sp. PtaB.Bin117]|uniref:YhcN/YlaJ family sporulation lipoprotein n=1 Tax=Pelotomaculum sp. PtaB.Bin117 TaxID=1811694 RepID=UPI0009CD533D|nr:YhcN/YlaJ family sporulation lipoprotein [Pelotomaculum sp. PtaB.Bin117]OPX85898.1 MAG: Sporulation lipoprotein YhcN/YlaJ (Spore_YhcN_YlaJ) [Pelotomaculum sp. PtaB.Bin117]OPY60971.1 MAG: Sporulation lipoprotein YhcN/YlaJ (Spore_YhcN_YlaJ) [Pelotomaculum sp. PtaU1.Bin065]
MKIIPKVIVLSLILLMTAGCGTLNSSLKKPQPEQQMSRDEKQIQVNPELAEKAKKTAGTVKGVKGCTAVVVNKDISTAIKVSGFDRLRLKPIKEEVHNKIKELNKDYNVHVTSDKKLFMQLQQIENQVNGPQEKPLTDIQKKVIKINKDIQG